jgi:acyl-CoA synthetase (AMP-forming)/AMP-acid ligase II
MTDALPTETPAPGTLQDLLHRARNVPGTGLRFVDRGERATFVEWSEVHDDASRVARSLLRLGVGIGERVAVIFPTCREFFAAFFGTLLARAVPVPLYPPVRLGRLEEYHGRTAAMVGACGARLLLAHGRVRRLLGPTVEQARLGLGCLTLDELPSAIGEEALPAPSSSDLALVQFSSGTTVEPKPVALSQQAVLAQVQALNGFWPEDAATQPGCGDRRPTVRHTGVSWLPLYHDMGLIGCVFPALERPSVLTLIGPEVFVTRPALWLRAISTYRATISVAPNFAYGLCVDKIADHELEGVDLSCWRVALNGAEPVSPDVLRAFQRRFARWGFREEALTPVYGLSEATLAVTFSALDRPFHAQRFERAALARGVAQRDPDGRELISVGKPLPGTEIRIAGESADQPALADGWIGRVWARGPSIMDGYLGRPEASARALQNGWLDTGDLGFVDDGELYLVGRAKDIVLLRGRNHSPIDLEQAVDGLPGVRTGCSVAVSHFPEGATGETLLLFVERRRNATPEALGALGERVGRAVLAACGVRPDEVLILAPGTLPRTSSGKLRRSETLRLHLAGLLRPPAPVTPWRLAGAMVRSSMAHARARRHGAAE